MVGSLSVPSGRFARGTVLLACYFLCKAVLLYIPKPVHKGLCRAENPYCAIIRKENGLSHIYRTPQIETAASSWPITPKPDHPQ